MTGYKRNMLWKNTNQLLKIEGYDGIKTGTTGAAGSCVVSTAERDGRRLIVVVLGCDVDRKPICGFAESVSLGVEGSAEEAMGESNGFERMMTTNVASANQVGAVVGLTARGAAS